MVPAPRNSSGVSSGRYSLEGNVFSLSVRKDIDLAHLGEALQGDLHILAHMQRRRRHVKAVLALLLVRLVLQAKRTFPYTSR
jgi:hypothetical protein